MNQEIKKMLDDLYVLDGSLVKHQAELIKIINQFIQRRPDTKFDENFARSLRAEIMARAASLKQAEPAAPITNIFNFNFMKKSYLMAGAGLVLFLILAPAIYFLSKTLPPAGQPGPLASQAIINQLPDQAFGRLTDQNQPASQEQSAGPQAENLGTDAMTKSSAPQFGLGGRGGGGVSPESSIIMPAPDMINYHYVYKGEEIILPADKLPVYKRLKDNLSAEQLARELGQLDISLLDLSRLSQGQVSNINLVENRDFGYLVYISFSEGLVSISSNWEKWPRPEPTCFDEQCYLDYQLKESDLPADQDIVALADGFLADFGVDLSGYGPGRVLDYWRRNYLLMKAGGMIAEDSRLAAPQLYIPDYIQVVYPLIIDGQTVYDESGNLSGLTVDVNIRYKKAAGLNNLFAQSFASSEYPAVQSSDKIIELAEQGGGFYPNYYYQTPAEITTNTREIDLGTPTLGLVRYWQYNQSSGQSDELFVPAYIFPITNQPADYNYLYRDSVIVPAVQDLIDRYDQDGSGRPLPLPLLKEDTMSQSAEPQPAQ